MTNPFAALASELDRLAETEPHVAGLIAAVEEASAELHAALASRGPKRNAGIDLALCRFESATWELRAEVRRIFGFKPLERSAAMASDFARVTSG